MSDTKIEWATKVWNPVTGCTPISEGCINCYAKRMSARLAGRCGYSKDDPFKVTFHPDKLDEPMHWRKPQKVFVCSMADLFHPNIEKDWRHAICAVMDKCPQHTFMILTKRSRAMQHLIMGSRPNVWLGTTVENNDHRDRLDRLLATPAAVRFVSVEPMLGPVDLKQWLYSWGDPFNEGRVVTPHPLSWVIAGPETGPKARDYDLRWFADLYHQCRAAGVPFFDKRDMLGKGIKECPKA